MQNKKLPTQTKEFLQVETKLYLRINQQYVNTIQQVTIILPPPKKKNNNNCETNPNLFICVVKNEMKYLYIIDSTGTITYCHRSFNGHHRMKFDDSPNKLLTVLARP